jgi:di/tricarboxylate transporter
LEPVIFVAILVLAFFLFSREIFPLEISALLVLVLLVFTGILESAEALSSFGNQSIIMIGSLFVLVSGLNKTGLIKRLEAQLLAVGGKSKHISFAIVLVLVAFVSAFVSNAATLAVTIPVVVSMAEKFGDSPRKWLMPVAFASVLGGMNTLVGTSTNIIISSLLPDYGISSFNLFTTASVGLPILLLGVIFLITCSGFLLKADGKEAADSANLTGIRPYTSDLTVKDDSPLCHTTIANSPLFREAGVTVLGVMRADQPMLVPHGSLMIIPGDRLILEGDISSLHETLHKHGLEFHDEVRPEEDEESGKKTRKEKKERAEESPDLGFHEVLVTARSRLNHRTAKEVSLRVRYRLSLIAINRQGETFRSKLSDIRIQAGDILVVQYLHNMERGVMDMLDLVPLQELKDVRSRSRYAPHALIIFVLSLLIGSVTNVSIAISCLAGCVAMVVLGILKTNEMYDAVEWRVLLFIGSVLCLGKGMEASGTAAILGENLATFFSSLENPDYAVYFFFLITVVMTQLLSNQATAVVMIPIAISTASILGFDPMTFIMSVTIAASCCFLTPFEPAFMLVYGPGRYKFFDFFRLGIFLSIIAVAVALYVIPRAFPVV